MSFFIGVFFFCGVENCYFLQIEDTFDKKEQCQKAVQQWDQYIAKKGIKTENACLEIKLKSNV